MSLESYKTFGVQIFITSSISAIYLHYYYKYLINIMSMLMLVERIALLLTCRADIIYSKTNCTYVKHTLNPE